MVRYTSSARLVADESLLRFTNKGERDVTPILENRNNGTPPSPQQEWEEEKQAWREQKERMEERMKDLEEENARLVEQNALYAARGETDLEGTRAHSQTL